MKSIRSKIAFGILAAGIAVSSSTAARAQDQLTIIAVTQG